MKKFINILLLIAPFIAAAAQDTLRVPLEYSTIQLAINASTDGDIVLVAPGTYSENINFKGKNILVTSHFIFNSDWEYVKNTIIYGSNPTNPDSASCVSFHSGEDSSAVIQGFTIRAGTGTKWIDPNNPGYIWRGGGGIFTFSSSPTIRMNIIVDNKVTNTTGVDGAQGGGTLSYNGNPKIVNNIIMQNEARYGAGIVIDYSGGIIKNNIIYKNSGGQDYGGGGFWSIGNGSSPIIIENNHIVENSVSGSGSYGGKGGAMFVWMGSVTARNNIIWGNTQTKGGPIAQIGGGTAIISYSDVEGGFTGEGNIDFNPEFADSNFYLNPTSNCIDSGNPDQIFNDVEDPVNPGFTKWPSQGELRNDMGVFGGPNCIDLPDVITAITEDNSNIIIPGNFNLFQNYPNPFNPSTRISYQIPEMSFVKLNVLDILGNEIEILVNEEKFIGSYDFEFDAAGLTSGIYFYQLKAGKYIETKKMLYLK